MDGDGTQAPGPPQTFSDPLSGPSGRRTHPKAGRSDFPDLEIAQPVEPDADMVREMVEATLREGDGDGRPGEGRDPDAAVAGDTGDTAQQDPPTNPFPPQQRTRPARPNLLPLILGLRQRGEHEDEHEQAPRRPQPRRRPSSGSAGLAVALVLLVVFTILAIQFVVSFVESITTLFS